jgi:hypothetical protein
MSSVAERGVEEVVAARLSCRLIDGGTSREGGGGGGDGDASISRLDAQ